MNVFTSTAVSATLAVNGHQTLLLADRPAPEGWVGRPLVIRADDVEPPLGQQIGEWRIGRVPDVHPIPELSYRHHPGRYVYRPGINGVLDLHPGHIVGSATLTAALPVVGPELCDGDLPCIHLDSDGLRRYTPGGLPDEYGVYETADVIETVWLRRHNDARDGRPCVAPRHQQRADGGGAS